MRCAAGRCGAVAARPGKGFFCARAAGLVSAHHHSGAWPQTYRQGGTVPLHSENMAGDSTSDTIPSHGSAVDFTQPHLSFAATLSGSLGPCLATGLQ